MAESGQIPGLDGFLVSTPTRDEKGKGRAKDVGNDGECWLMLEIK